MHNLCHVPHVSRITTWGTTFMERHFSVSREWVRPWSNAFLITYQKTFTKKLFGGPYRKSDKKEKKKKTRMAIAKLFALKPKRKKDKKSVTT